MSGEGLQLPVGDMVRAERFLRACDRLAQAGDAFRGRGRVIFEGDDFSVHYDVSAEDHARPSLVVVWADGRPGWRVGGLLEETARTPGSYLLIWNESDERAAKEGVPPASGTV